jgi:hypothetical protein
MPRLLQETEEATPKEKGGAEERWNAVKREIAAKSEAERRQQEILRTFICIHQPFFIALHPGSDPFGSRMWLRQQEQTTTIKVFFG